MTTNTNKKQNKTRLELLCEIHGQQGGIIHEFNKKYRTDINAMTEKQWLTAFKVIKKSIELKIPISFNV